MKNYKVKKEIVKLYEEKKYKAMLQLFETLEPEVFREVFVEFVNEQYEQNKIDVFDVLANNLSEEDWEKFLWLDSSEREKKYLMNIAKTRELTAEELADLRACDF
nr:MAG TPA: hypothetical protein [Caudoviricetes sp.]